MAAFDPQGRPVKRQKTTHLKSELQNGAEMSAEIRAPEQEHAVIKQEGDVTATSRRGWHNLRNSSQIHLKPALPGLPRSDCNFMPETTSSNPTRKAVIEQAPMSSQFQMMRNQLNGLNEGQNLKSDTRHCVSDILFTGGLANCYSMHQEIQRQQPYQKHMQRHGQPQGQQMGPANNALQATQIQVLCSSNFKAR
jgi:hypothetical protein